MVELDEHTAVMRMNGLGEKHPVRPVTVGREGKLMVPEGIVDVINGCRLDNDEADAAFCTLFIIGDRARAGMGVILSVEHLHRRHNRTVFDAQGPDHPGGKQFWISHWFSFQGSAAWGVHLTHR